MVLSQSETKSADAPIPRRRGRSRATDEDKPLRPKRGRRRAPSPASDDEVAASSAEETPPVSRRARAAQTSTDTKEVKKRRLNSNEDSPRRRQTGRARREEYFYEESEESDEVSNDEESEDELRIEKIFGCRWRVSEEPIVEEVKNVESQIVENEMKDVEMKDVESEKTESEKTEIEKPESETAESDPQEKETSPESKVEPSITSPSSAESSSSSSPGDSATPSTEQSSPGGREMEYLVKFEGVSYRQLKWKTKDELVVHKNDTADLKIHHFHRKMTPGKTNKEVPLIPQDEGNFLLYSKIDRILSARPVEDSDDETSKTSKTEYLIKWQLLGYSESTWELGEDLKSEEDLEAIQRYTEINLSFEFPVCAPVPGTVMAAESTPSRRRRTARAEVVDEEPGVGVIKGETYKSDAVTNEEGATRFWKMFLKRKLAANGTYIPSIKWQKKEGSNERVQVSSRSLMAHQQEGLKWLFFNTEINQHGSLLADEMGLGKTCQSIAFLEHLLDVMSAGRNVGCHALVVVQKSVLENWRREFDVWAPHLNVLALCGGRQDRDIAMEFEHKWHNPETGEPVTPPSNLSSRKLMKPDVVLVTYEGLRTPEFRKLVAGTGTRNFKWTCVVVDECQKVKGGKTSLLLQLLSQLKRDLMVLLTGTPVQNTTEELFPMLTLLDPPKFYYEELRDNKNSNSWSAAKFSASFSQIQDREDCMELTEELHQLMAPYILRREKAHVLKTLPPKTVKLVKIPLTLIQKRVYSALYHKSIRTKGLKFSNIHMQLRKACIHPYLIEGMEELISDGKIGDDKKEEKKEAGDIKPISPDRNADEKAKRLILECSGKFVLLRKMLEAFREQGRKVLIFSFFKTALDLIEDFIVLYDFGWTIERVDGETSGEDRQLAIDRFNSDSKRFLFLCTTRAGGLGINLTAASVVIHLDSDFNPQHDLQAQARCHRIGQDKNVDVFHFIAEHTYEDYMLFTIAGKKLGLEAVLLGRLDATKGKAKLDKQQEEKVLRKGVYAAIRDDDSAGREAQEFAELSIEQILSTKSTTVVLDGDGGEETPTEAPSAAEEPVEVETEESQPTEEANEQPKLQQHSKLFATAKFTVSNDNADLRKKNQKESGLEGLNEDEPDFWVKVAQRLGPWVLEEEKPQILTRADRRRGRNVNYRSAFYDEEYFAADGRRRTRADDEEDTEESGQRRTEEARDEDRNDEVFTPVSGSENSDTDESDLDTMTKEDIEVALHTGEKVRLPGSSIKSKRKSIDDEMGEGKRIALRNQMNWSDWSDLRPVPPAPTPPPPAESFGQSNPKVNSQSNSFGLPSGALGMLVALDLLFRCLRALKRWRATKVGETGGLRTDDVRDADRCSPWSLSSLPAQKTSATSGADQLLRQSWLETLQEWKQAGIDWDARRSVIVDRFAKQVLQHRRDVLEAQWTIHIKSLSFGAIKSKEQLIQQMNQFFVAEARRQALATHGDAIVHELQNFCDDLASEVLTGRHFSREFTVKKQTWIGAEDFCIKLVFVHLMAQRYAANNAPATRSKSTMRWPPPLLEVNWAVVTEVIKKLNKYTGGPERRRAAIHERFYNKLDSRWNHEDFSPQEREVLALALANGLAAHIVAEELPSRSLERVKKGLRCPSVIREAQREGLLIQRLVGDEAVSNGGSVVVDIICRFREICKEMGLNEGAPATEGSRNPPSPAVAICGSQPPQEDHNLQGVPQPLPPAWQGERKAEGSLTPSSLLVQSIRSVLLRIGVQEGDFETLRPQLMKQGVDSLTNLLRSLRDVEQQQTAEERNDAPTPLAAARPFANSSAPVAMGHPEEFIRSPDIQMRRPTESAVARSEPPKRVPTESMIVLDDDDMTGSTEAETGGSPPHIQRGIPSEFPAYKGEEVSRERRLVQAGIVMSTPTPITKLPVMEQRRMPMQEEQRQPNPMQRSLSTLLQMAGPSQDQLKEIHHRMQSDPMFASRVMDQISRLQTRTEEAHKQD